MTPEKPTPYSRKFAIRGRTLNQLTANNGKRLYYQTASKSIYFTREAADLNSRVSDEDLFHQQVSPYSIE